MKNHLFSLSLGAAGLVALGLVGCANRGMHAPTDGPVGVGGSGGHVDASADGPRDVGGTGGAAACNADAGADAGDAGDAGTCPALFNFESPGGCSLYGASLDNDTFNPANTAGFKNLYRTSMASCGQGALAVDVDLNGNTAKGGSILIPINAANYTGKTLSIAVKASVAGPSTVHFYVLLASGSSFQTILNVPLSTTWTTFNVPLASATDASVSMVTLMSLQVLGGTSTYTGTVYVDEIDFRTTPPDAGTTPSDAAGGG
jgi:hypothetical protein